MQVKDSGLTGLLNGLSLSVVTQASSFAYASLATRTGVIFLAYALTGHLCN
jgi:hypothetical protein